LTPRSPAPGGWDFATMPDPGADAKGESHAVDPGIDEQSIKMLQIRT
jgi:hypothetical protein